MPEGVDVGVGVEVEVDVVVGVVDGAVVPLPPPHGEPVVRIL